MGWQIPWDQSLIAAVVVKTRKRIWIGKRGLSRIAHLTPNVLNDGKNYLLSETGETTVIEAGAQFKVVSRNPVREKCQASIAVSEGSLFISAAENLFSIAR